MEMDVVNRLPARTTGRQGLHPLLDALFASVHDQRVARACSVIIIKHCPSRKTKRLCPNFEL